MDDPLLVSFEKLSVGFSKCTDLKKICSECIHLRIICLTLPNQKEKERKTICSCKEEVNYKPKRLTLNEEHPLEEGIKLREDVNLLSLKRRS